MLLVPYMWASMTLWPSRLSKCRRHIENREDPGDGVEGRDSCVKVSLHFPVVHLKG